MSSLLVEERAQLKRELIRALSWDEFVVEGLVDVLVSAKDLQEVDDIIMNFMADSKEAQEIVMKFVASKTDEEQNTQTVSPKNGGASRDKDKQHPARPSAKNKGTERHEKKLFDPTRRRRSDESKWYNANSSHKSRSKTKQHAESSSSKRAGDRKNADAMELEGKRHVSDGMQREVANCMGCGKIYDSGKITDALLAFIESGGICDFCGTRVNLSAKHDPQRNAEQNGIGQKDKEAETDEDRALAFKDRLVDYDRNAAKRTTVLDDQGDYFEIESNLWLEEKEKKELKLQRELEQEMEKSLRNKVHYTIDLIGRRVFVSEDVTQTEEAKRVADAAQAAAHVTSSEIPQGGGTGAQAASQTATRLGDRQESEELRFRVQSNPGVKKTSPLFLPSRQALEQSRIERTGPKWIQGCKGRLQHDDVFAEFDEDYEPEVQAADLSAYAELFDNYDNGVFDLCPETNPDAARPIVNVQKSNIGVSANARLSSMLGPSAQESSAFGMNGAEPLQLKSAEEFPDGLILLKNWLSFEEQLRIVTYVRNLGIGNGGFYTPMYQQKSQMRLKMMCLGLNWNPVNRVYEEARTNLDGALAPPVPEFMKDLVRCCMKDANRLRGYPFTPIDPNVCICNFYARDSSLGLHQDREEGEESLRRKIPVVSFSIGAAGEFLFGATRSVENAETILLESGDVLVFGGPSRMLFHGIRRIFPESMPSELTESIGMRLGRLNLTLRQYIPDH